MADSGKPIEDYYGTEITVEVVGHSAGYMVDLERNGKGLINCFDSFSAAQARELAARLVNAAEEIEP